MSIRASSSEVADPAGSHHLAVLPDGGSRVSDDLGRRLEPTDAFPRTNTPWPMAVSSLVAERSFRAQPQSRHLVDGPRRPHPHLPVRRLFSTLGVEAAADTAVEYVSVRHPAAGSVRRLRGHLLTGDLVATPGSTSPYWWSGAVLASFVGTMGASHAVDTPSVRGRLRAHA